MSAGERLWKMTRLSRAALFGIFGWLLVAPLAAIIPKRRDWIAVIGRQDGQFLDNAKYFFLQATQIDPGLRVVYLTGRADIQRLLAGHRLAVLRYPSLRACWFLARCASVIVDSVEWQQSMRRFLLSRAKVVQLWHGVGFKRIERDRWQHEVGKPAWAASPLLVQVRLCAYWLTGRQVRYAAVATTSGFYKSEVFSRALHAKYFPIVGYPRNDFGQSLHGERQELAWANVDADVRARVDEWATSRHKLVLIAPTFRDSGDVPMQLDLVTLSAIDRFAETNGVEFVFKFHPYERNTDHIAGHHFHVCARDSDIYPIFPHAAALVTDYSSISMDFLFVDKPLLFLIPHGDEYIQKDRQLQFDPRSMMPGPVVPDWPTLLLALLAEWARDAHVAERAELRRKAFDNLPQSQAVPKLLDFMRDRGWVE